jgi:hypothetical protein
MGLTKDRNGVVQMLSWVDAVLSSTSEYRRRLVKQALSDIETYKSVTDQPTPQGLALADLLRNPKEFELVGIVPNLMYIRVEGDREDLEPVWIHPWALPMLVFKHKKTCSMVIAGASQRWNETALQEIPMNRSTFSSFFRRLAGIIGATG